MAREPFLINPPKRAPRRKGKAPRRSLWRPPSRSLLGKEGSKHRPTVYSYKGHWFTSSAAKIAKPGLKLNPRRRRRYRNPFGAEAMLVGLNPRRRSAMSFFRRRRRKSNPKRRRHARRYSMNPRRRSSRRYRRNPFSVSGVMNTGTSYAPTIAGAIGGMMAVRALPKMLGVTGIPFYGVQLGVIVGGNFALKKLSSKAAEGFVIGAAGTAVYDIAKGLLGTTFSYLGLGEEMLNAYPQVGAYTDDSYGSYDGFADYHANLD